MSLLVRHVSMIGFDRLNQNQSILFGILAAYVHINKLVEPRGKGLSFILQRKESLV